MKTKIVSGWNFLMMVAITAILMNLSLNSQLSATTPVTNVDDINEAGEYLISDVSGLIALREFVNRGSGTTGYTFTQTQDIVLTSRWIPIGGPHTTTINYDLNSTIEFDGVYDGSMYVISGLIIQNINTGTTRVSANHMGLFGKTGENSQVKNLQIINPTLDIVNPTASRFISVLIGENNGMVSNVSIEFGSSSKAEYSVVGNANRGSWIGILTGKSNSTAVTENSDIIFKDDSTLVYNWTQEAGVFMGQNDGIAFNNDVVFKNNAEMTTKGGAGHVLGGFVGKNTGTIFNSSFRFKDASLATFTSSENISEGVGLFVGNNAGLISKSYVDTSHSSGVINNMSSATDRLAGFVAINGVNATIEVSYAINRLQNLRGAIYGFVGRNFGEVSNTYTAGEITNSQGFIVGAAGFVFDGTGTIKNSFTSMIMNKANVNAVNRLFDNSSNPVIQNSFYFSGVLALGDSVVVNERTGLFEGISPTNISSGVWQENVLNSGINGFFLVDGYYPLIYSSGTTTLLDNQTLNFVRYDLEPNTPSDTAYLVRVETNGAQSIDTLVVLSGESISIPAITRTNFNFAGWYTDAEFTLAYVLSTPVTSNLTIYAKWAPASSNSPEPPTIPNVMNVVPYYDYGNGVPYIYDPIFASIDVIETMTVEVNSLFELPSYRGVTIFGAIVRDYTSGVVISGKVDTTKVGTYELTFSLFVDGLSTSETLFVYVVDTVPPVIHGPSIVNLFTGETYNHQLNITDNYDAVVDVVKSVEVDTAIVRTFDVQYTATDASGNSTTFDQKVVIKMPQVIVKAAKVGSQQFIFVVSERNFDLTSVKLYMAHSTIQPDEDSVLWTAYEERDFITQGPGERVFLMLLDDMGNTITRESLDLLWIPETSFPSLSLNSDRNTTMLMVTGIGVGGFSLGGMLLYMLKYKKRHS